jgi:hypothetical protein
MGILTDFYNLLAKGLHHLKTWLLLADNINELSCGLTECKFDIKATNLEVIATREIVNRIDTFGSSGAMKGITKLGDKIDILDCKLQSREDKLHKRITDVDNKLDIAAVDLARLKGIVINGKKV